MTSEHDHPKDEKSPSSIEMHRDLVNRVFQLGAPDNQEVEDITEYFHLAHITVVFHSSPPGLKIDLEANREGFTPNPDWMSATWSYANREQGCYTERSKDMVERADCYDQTNIQVFNSLRLLENAVITVEDGLAAGHAEKQVVLA